MTWQSVCPSVRSPVSDSCLLCVVALAMQPERRIGREEGERSGKRQKSRCEAGRGRPRRLVVCRCHNDVSFDVPVLRFSRYSHDILLFVLKKRFVLPTMEHVKRLSSLTMSRAHMCGYLLGHFAWLYCALVLDIKAVCLAQGSNISVFDQKGRWQHGWLAFWPNIFAQNRAAQAFGFLFWLYTKS